MLRVEDELRGDGLREPQAHGPRARDADVLGPGEQEPRPGGDVERPGRGQGQPAAAVGLGGRGHDEVVVVDARRSHGQRVDLGALRGLVVGTDDFDLDVRESRRVPVERHLADVAAGGTRESGLRRRGLVVGRDSVARPRRRPLPAGRLPLGPRVGTVALARTVLRGRLRSASARAEADRDARCERRRRDPDAARHRGEHSGADDRFAAARGAGLAAPPEITVIELPPE
jgi:hypothetical protein